MKKLISFKDLAQKKKVKPSLMDSSDVETFNHLMKQIVRESSKNSQKANLSAAKVFLTR